MFYSVGGGTGRAREAEAPPKWTSGRAKPPSLQVEIIYIYKLVVVILLFGCLKSRYWNKAIHCKNKLVVLITEWLATLVAAYFGNGGYESFMFGIRD